MVKRKLVLGFALVSLVTAGLVSHNLLKDRVNFNESTLAEDATFSKNNASVVAGRLNVKKQNDANSLITPKIGYQMAYSDDNSKVSIRYTAAISSLDVKATWTRAMYDAGGDVFAPYAAKEVEVTTAYTGLTNGGEITYATDILDDEGNTPYNYFVVYSLLNVPVETYGTYFLDAYLTLSDGENEVVSKVGAIEFNEENSFSYDLGSVNDLNFKLNETKKSYSIASTKKENYSITFGSEGNYKTNEHLNMGTCQFGDNGGNNSQIKNGYFSIDVKAGAIVTVNGYRGYTSYTVSVNGGEASEEITQETYVINADVDSTIVFTPVSGNNYLYGIDVTYSSVISSDTNITFGADGNYLDYVQVDNSQVRPNGNNSQVKAPVSFDVAAGATITVNSFSGYTHYNVTINDDEPSEEQTGTEYTFTVDSDSKVVLTPTDGNNYFYNIDIKFENADTNLATDLVIPAYYSDGTHRYKVTEIEESAFENHSHLTSVFIPKTVKKVGANAFKGCSSLVINCEELAQPETFDENWNPDNRPVTWGVGNDDFVDPTVISESTLITFGSEGNYKDSKLEYDPSLVGDNGGNNSQVKGEVTFKVKKGAVVTINGYPNYTNYGVVVNGKEYASEVLDTTFVLAAKNDSTITIVPNVSNNYLYSINVQYLEYISNDTSISFGSEGNYNEFISDKGDANFRDNGGNNSQISKGSFSINVKEGATVTVNGYPNYTSYKVLLNGVLFSAEEVTDVTYSFYVNEDSVITFTAVNSNNYLYSIDIAF